MAIEKTMYLCIDLVHLLTIEPTVSATCYRVNLIRYSRIVKSRMEPKGMAMRNRSIGISMHGENRW